MLTSQRTPRNNVLHISARFSDKLRKLRLRQRATSLLDTLRAELGSDFLGGARIFVTNPIQRNLFMSSYSMNFPPADFAAGRMWWEGVV